MKQETTKDKILDKALELFSENGYDAVSVGDIARAVGIKAPSLYSHYPSKQAIFDAVFEDTALQYEKCGKYLYTRCTTKKSAAFGA